MVMGVSLTQGSEDGDQEAMPSTDPIKEVLNGLGILGQVCEFERVEAGSDLFVSVEAPQVGDLQGGSLVKAEHPVGEFGNRFEGEASPSDDHAQAENITDG